MSSIRTFIAVSLDSAQSRSVVRLQSELKGGDDRGIRWVAKEHFHVNLAFLGDVESSKLVGVCEMVKRVASDHAPFSWQPRGLGAFPNLRRPNVLWVGVRDLANSFAAIREDLQMALVEIGFEPDPRPFRPHVTLGRVRRGGRVPHTVIEGIKNRQNWQGAASDALEIQVVGSDLGPSGPVYTVIASCQFAVRD